MVSKDTAGKMVTVVCALYVSLGIVNDGFQTYEEGAPMAEWVPSLSMGLIVVSFLVVTVVGTRVGDDPKPAEGFTLTLLTMVVGFALTAAAGIAYVTLHFSVILSWGHVIIGVGGLLAMLWAWLRTPS